MDDLRNIVTAFCKENHLELHLSHDMPSGYETAFGTYDVTVNTLFLNLKMLENAPAWEILFYLYHELRHAEQYLHPERFDLSIQESLYYVILYNGVCYKLIDNTWYECSLDGEDFTDAYLSLPYEMDANRFAYIKVKDLCPNPHDLHELFRFCLPKKQWSDCELHKLFKQIDEKLQRKI